jgi:4-amino-4-deoxy-L-arabinose transferase-like glycosyltransferase
MSLTPQRLTPNTNASAPVEAGEDASPRTPANTVSEQSGWLRAVAIAATFATLIILAAWLRGAAIWPEAAGLNESPYDDEGVYATAAQLLAQGKHPYRDFLFAHPPLGPALLAPAVDYRYTTWGSPTSFMMLRYASVAYGALTVGLVFLIAWRLWGLAGGLVGATLLALDPNAIWASRHVMLEGPLFFLAALAVLAYILAREEDRPPMALLLLAGFFAAAAGGVKLQGLIVLAAMAIDLLVRRRGVLLANLLIGAALFCLPLWGYLLWLGASDPLGQFVFLQLLRPGDGLVGQLDRAQALWSGGWLLLAVGGLALLALPGLLFRPDQLRRAERAKRRRASAQGGMDLPRLSLVDGSVSDAPSRRGVRSAPRRGSSRSIPAGAGRCCSPGSPSQSPRSR